jgi:hypothetical protein
VRCDCGYFNGRIRGKAGLDTSIVVVVLLLVVGGVGMKIVIRRHAWK